MDRYEKLVIQHSFPYLVNEGKADELLDYLFSKFAIDQDDYQRVFRGQVTDSDKMRELLGILMRKPRFKHGNVFQALLDAFKNEKRGDVSEALMKCYTNIKSQTYLKSVHEVVHSPTDPQRNNRGLRFTSKTSPSNFIFRWDADGRSVGGMDVADCLSDVTGTDQTRTTTDSGVTNDSPKLQVTTADQVKKAVSLNSQGSAGEVCNDLYYRSPSACLYRCDADVRNVGGMDVADCLSDVTGTDQTLTTTDSGVTNDSPKLQVITVDQVKKAVSLNSQGSAGEVCNDLYYRSPSACLYRCDVDVHNVGGMDVADCLSDVTGTDQTRTTTDSGVTNDSPKLQVITADQVKKAVSLNSQGSSGKLSVGGRTFSFKTSGQYSNGNLKWYMKVIDDGTGRSVEKLSADGRSELLESCLLELTSSS